MRVLAIVLVSLSFSACSSPIGADQDADANASADGSSVSDAASDAVASDAILADASADSGQADSAAPDGGCANDAGVVRDYRPRRGDLIQASGPAVYFVAADMRRYVFPNERRFYSWYADFCSVLHITDADLAAIAIGGNVTMRPGTWLVKITTDPKVYAVTRCDTLHWIQSEALADQLYGRGWRGMVVMWHDRVVDKPDPFFVNYSIGASISTPVHPDGTLIRYAGMPDTFLIQGGMRRRITPVAFTANRFREEFVVQTTIMYPDGADVTGFDPELSEPVPPSCLGMR